MKYITQLEDDVEFLNKTYDCAEKVLQFIDNTDLMTIRNAKPKGLVALPPLPSKELPVEEQARIMKERAEIVEKNEKAINSQMLENAKKILGNICKKYPKDFVELMHMMIVLEDGEKMPHGLKLLTTAIAMFTDKDMMDFFYQLTQLGQDFTVK